MSSHPAFSRAASCSLSLIVMSIDAALPARRPRSTIGSLPWWQLARFAVVGVASTGGYALLYLLLRSPAGPFAANALALLITAIANTATNRRLTFGVRGGSGLIGDHAVGLLAFGAGLGLTTGALALTHPLIPPGRWPELIVLTIANAMATLLRFAALRVNFARR